MKTEYIKKIYESTISNILLKIDEKYHQIVEEKYLEYLINSYKNISEESLKKNLATYIRLELASWTTLSSTMILKILGCSVNYQEFIELYHEIIKKNENNEITSVDAKMYMYKLEEYFERIEEYNKDTAEEMKEQLEIILTRKKQK